MKRLKFNIDVQALQAFISQYKANFAQHRLGAGNEIYKWKAVKCFKDNWDIEATDFPAMLAASLGKCENLLSSNQFYPKQMLLYFAEKEPEKTRGLFRELFNENTDLVKRVKAFEEGAALILKANPASNKISTYQNPNSISTYLWLRYPDKYYIYKYSLIKDCAEKLGWPELPTDKYDRLVYSFNLYDSICEELAKDASLAAMSSQSLGEDCYPDEALKTLTIDLVYFVSRHEVVKSVSLSAVGEKVKAKNLILYGPPGTGKTYSAIQYAVALIEEKNIKTVREEDYGEVYKRFCQHKDNGLIAFTTFHQSFGYEEFIEGIRPVLVSEDGSGAQGIDYEIRDGVFKDFCKKAGTPVGPNGNADLGLNKSPKVWKVSLESTGDNKTRKDCLDNGYIRIGWDRYGESISEIIEEKQKKGSLVLNSFYNKMQIGDIVLSCFSNTTIDAIGVITGEPEWHDKFERYKRLRPVKWLAKSHENIVALNSGKVMAAATVYELSVSVSDIMGILRKTAPQLFNPQVKIPNRVFIIDEINRGNISKIFGELITVIEPEKRIGAPEEIRLTLPYSGLRFGVPDNVHIIGTMNTADRSIALMDTALRRRFRFIEMRPDSGLLLDMVVGGLEIAEMLDTLNRRISVLLDREHTLGHSYFLPLKNEPSIDKLAEIFELSIVPLLKEYFYDDYGKIQLVLGDNRKIDDSARFVIKKSDTASLFGKTDQDYPEIYEINREAFKKIEAYAFLT